MLMAHQYGVPHAHVTSRCVSSWLRAIVQLGPLVNVDDKQNNYLERIVFVAARGSNTGEEK